MTQTMRERLCVALVRSDDDLCCSVGVSLSSATFGADCVRAVGYMVDAILAELRTPDYDLVMLGHQQGLGNVREAFTAMIDAVREGK